MNDQCIDRYATPGKKLTDFLWGFIGVIAVISAGSALLGTINWGVGATFFLSLYCVGIIFYFMKGRRFVAIGMLCFLLVPLLSIGACFVAISKMHFN